MSNYFILTLDTTAPANPKITINGGSAYTVSQLVDLTLSTDDPDTTNYQMKIWGDVDPTHDSNIQTTEKESSWISFTTSKQVKLSAGDGTKRLYFIVRDDVHNASSQVSSSIILDATKPEVTITGPDVTKISKVAGKNTASFTFSVDKDYTEYKVKVVSSPNALHDSGTLIPTDGGSTNTSGTGEFTEDDIISVSVTGNDIDAISSGDGEKIIKVFAKDVAGNWSS